MFKVSNIILVKCFFLLLINRLREERARPFFSRHVGTIINFVLKKNPLLIFELPRFAENLFVPMSKNEVGLSSEI